MVEGVGSSGIDGKRLLLIVNSIFFKFEKSLPFDF
jgi:hypothetical protein